MKLKEKYIIKPIHEKLLGLIFYFPFSGLNKIVPVTYISQNGKIDFRNLYCGCTAEYKGEVHKGSLFDSVDEFKEDYYMPDSLINSEDFLQAVEIIKRKGIKPFYYNSEQQKVYVN